MSHDPRRMASSELPLFFMDSLFCELRALMTMDVTVSLCCAHHRSSVLKQESPTISKAVRKTSDPASGGAHKVTARHSDILSEEIVTVISRQVVSTECSSPILSLGYRPTCPSFF